MEEKHWPSLAKRIRKRMCQPLLCDANVCFICGLFFQQHFFFCQLGVCKTQDNELLQSGSIWYIAFLLFSLLVPHLLFLLLLFWSLSTVERKSCLCNKHQSSCPKWQVKCKINFPQTKAECSEHKTTEWLEPQYKSNCMFHNETFLRCVHEPAFAAKHYERQFKCIKFFHIPSVDPNKNVHIYSF